MKQNKRRGEPAIPTDADSLMTYEQKTALQNLEGFGWELSVLRRPKFEPVEVVLQHSEGYHLRLQPSGELDYDNPPPMRREEVAAPPPAGEDPWAGATDAGEFELVESQSDADPVTVGGEPLPKGGNNKRPPKIIV